MVCFGSIFSVLDSIRLLLSSRQIDEPISIADFFPPKRARTKPDKRRTDEFCSFSLISLAVIY
jgi:hypothetical protein